MRMGDQVYPAPEEDGSHRYASSGQSIVSVGRGPMRLLYLYKQNPPTTSRSSRSGSQTTTWGFETVEAGWQEFQDADR